MVNTNEEIVYWITLAHIKGWKTEKINTLIHEILTNKKISLKEFFEMDAAYLAGEFGLSQKEIIDLENAKKELPNNSFVAEDLLAQGFEIIPINSDDYPPTLKENLKIKYAPPILYTKGNKQLLKEKTAAIVGSRNASQLSLDFADNLAKIFTQEFKVVVSGFAKGVDKQALDSSLKYIGQSIIVLPQGILTFGSSIQKYYSQIVEGNVLVLSTYFPRVPWDVGFAMGRNTYIYGLAKEIYVAESDNKGGTWSGVIDGLRKGRTIYIRKPNENENNANNLLIAKGAIPVDFNGTPISQTYKEAIPQMEVAKGPKLIFNAEEKEMTLKKKRNTTRKAEEQTESLFALRKEDNKKQTVIEKSSRLFEEAIKYIPGGVNSPVRAFKSVGGTPRFMAKGIGSKMYDVDGNELIDYIGSWGPHLFGHNPEFITTALLKAIQNGTSFGAPTEIEIKMAKLITELVPSIEMVRMVNSGTEATMSAVRVARGYTGKDKIIKFEGCYHGHGDFFLIKAGSGALTFGVPTSPGVTKGNAADTLVADFNDISSIKKLVAQNKKEIAAVIIEAVVGNMGTVRANDSFIKELRTICDEEKIVLIFDEVMTGFRLAKGGAQEILGVKPDLSTFGKIIGGGLPVGAYGGKKEIMEIVSPSGPVYQAGTLSGNPLAMNAGYAALSYIQEHPEVYQILEEKSAYLENGIKDGIKSAGKDYQFNRIGSMMTFFFTEEEVVDYNSAVKSDTLLYGKYFHEMLNRGIYLPPAQFEAMFVSTAHTKEDLDKTIKASSEALKAII